jgi:predicted DNA-binding transcriptional regulator YafY
MGRFERVLGILLHLRAGKEISAFDLAHHFGVSRRTIYRDMEMLSALGVPVYAERGHAGGFRLLEGYFLPPVMFSKGEAVSLLLSVTLLRSLRTKPFPADLVKAEKKLLAAMPAAA